MLIRGSAFVFVVLLLVAPAAGAQPIAVDPTLSLTSSIAFPGAQSARFDPAHPDVRWIGARGLGANDGIYRIGFAKRRERIAAGSNVAGVLVDPITGDVFFSEDFGGVIHRIDPDVRPAVRVTWVSGFHAGDDDPIGMRIAPARHSGGIVRPGEAVVVDRGFNGPDEIWVWSSTIAQAQTLLVPDANNPMLDPVDLAFGTDALFIADAGDTGPGRIWQVDGNGAITELVTQSALSAPVAIEYDPSTGELLLLDGGSGRLLSVSSTTGAVRELITGLTVPADEWSSLDVRPDGSELLITTGSVVWTFSRCTTGLTAANDCDGNGVLDRCDLASGTASDCNANGLPDQCDIAGGASTDCEGDGVPDECPQCPPVEVVVAFDTSTSMNDEASALCAQVSEIRAELRGRGLTITTELLGISDAPGGAYACLEDHVINRYGTTVPPPGNDVLGSCPGGNEVASEDWGRATSVVAGTKVWGAGTVRVVVPIADEGPWCGDPVTQLDTDSITHAIRTATTAQVRISPITGTGSTQPVIDLAARLAQESGGIHHRTNASNTDIPESVLSVVRGACFAAVDCNANQIVDSCDIASGGSSDCDADGVPDDCQDPPAMCGAMDAGVDPTDDAGEESDAGVEVDGGASDAGPEEAGSNEDAEPGADATPDAEPGADAEPLPDAALVKDSGSSRPDASMMVEEEEGCACSATATRAGRGSLAWLLLAGVIVRRRWKARR